MGKKYEKIKKLVGLRDVKFSPAKTRPLGQARGAGRQHSYQGAVRWASKSGIFSILETKDWDLEGGKCGKSEITNGFR